MTFQYRFELAIQLQPHSVFLFGDNVSGLLIHHQIALGQSTSGVMGFTVPDLGSGSNLFLVVAASLTSLTSLALFTLSPSPLALTLFVFAASELTIDRAVVVLHDTMLPASPLLLALTLSPFALFTLSTSLALALPSPFALFTSTLSMLSLTLALPSPFALALSSPFTLALPPTFALSPSALAALSSAERFGVFHLFFMLPASQFTINSTVVVFDTTVLFTSLSRFFGRSPS